MDKAKPFDIPKREVWEAFKRVKANQGAAGVDGQSIAESGTGEEIDKREVVKGYEYSRGEFVTFTAEELKALDVESSKVIDLEKFVPRGALDPVYFESRRM